MPSPAFSPSPPCLAASQSDTPELPNLLGRALAPLVVAIFALQVGACATSLPSQDLAGEKSDSNGGSFEEFCAENPQDETCVHCQQNPQECQGPGDDTGSDTGTDTIYCEQNPQAPACQGDGSQGGVNCQQYPQDPQCQGGGGQGSFEQYCQ